MSWETSLVRIADHKVEELRKRLAGVAERKALTELKLAMLHAEAEAEKAHGPLDAEAGWYKLGFLQGWRLRRDQTLQEISALEIEEAGARDALTDAFEELKKFEQVADSARSTKAKAQTRRENAAFDEIGLRKSAG